MKLNKKMIIKKLYCISEDLYYRDIVETDHAVNSGTNSIDELKKKYECITKKNK
jgi:tRNA G26 N,N-dimethylase Trm1